MYGAVVHAAPGMPSVSGAISTGSTVTISGSSFGAHALQLESLQAHIEAATPGNAFYKSGWELEDWYLYGPVPRYANDFAHSGTKSIKCDMSARNGDCTYAYDMPDVGPGQRFYATWWVKFNGAANGQWKMFRASYGLTIQDNFGQLNMYNWFAEMQQNVMHPGTAYERSLYYSTSPSFYPTADNTWHRIELDYRAASTAGSSDGVITVRVTKDDGTIQTANNSDVNTHPTGLPWRYGIFQNYLGNEHVVGTEIWLDDHYIQYNTPARVELCSGSTWATRGKCEIQIPTAWGTSSITAAVNPGNFASGSTAYVYVVDSAGDANATGTAVTIGESSTPTPIDGACGSSDGGTFSSAPTANLCLAGTPSAVSGTTSFSWTCEGINGSDIDDSCSASLTSGSASAWLTSGGSVLTSGGAVITPAQ